MIRLRAVAGWTAETVVASTVPVALIRSARTTYPVIAAPPVDVGGVQLAVAVIVPPATPLAAVPMTAAVGTVAGVTAFDPADSVPSPTAFTARTRKVYAVPLVSPVTTVLVAVPATPVTVRTTVVPVRTCTW